MQLNQLTRQGEEIRDKVANSSDFRSITLWLSSASVYLETRHKSLKETASFLAEKDRFKALVLEKDEYSLLLFDSLLGTLKAIEMLEDLQAGERNESSRGTRNWNDF
ncbi:hypothetical protein [Saccharibacillus kuerlensis]|uniref:Uncharacterized protein n=1 Tax=Saccharibacillus kuerlensis TaxID=459527 RepID=A0ABQ2KXH6_9BACL|nr:hypothetical protein [Saccharibacillus kuerlensis]GGN96210.1 hypothetical protein GCM10010969_12960 [Saccharibacillus kuerlensis]